MITVTLLLALKAASITGITWPGFIWHSNVGANGFAHRPTPLMIMLSW